jgi:carbamoyltransferase
MIVLGISGFENAMAFKKSHWPGLHEREYRISQGHDSAAALVVHGEIVAAAAEERFSRAKHTGSFPEGAVRYCMSAAGITADEIDEIAHGFDYSPYRPIFQMDPVSAEQYRQVFSREALLERLTRALPGFPADRFHQVDHHLAHAASASYTSGWEECLVLVIDGMGEAHSVTAYHARDNRLERLWQVSAIDSIGILYSVVTLHLGFDFNSDEYKIMGLAPYGDPTRFRAFFRQAVERLADGRLRIPLLRLNSSREDRETYGGTRRFLQENLVPCREPEAEIQDVHRDVAAALQECLDEVMLHLCEQAGRSTGLRRLAMAGGVALNCTANGKLLRSGCFDEVYVQPAAGDDGSALGAALWRASRGGTVRNARMPVPFLGPAPASHDIDEAIDALEDRITIVRFSTLGETCAEAAKWIHEGRVVAWYRGRMEFGPRALGHRSILADPGDPEMRDRINAMVKMREAFRPFAPAVSLEQVQDWFEVSPGTELPYMIVTVDVREAHRQSLPAITHVNGSARVQTVSREDNAEFHELLRAVGKLTGREMVLNTSFNIKGQPIVNTPREAIETFLGTGIEGLFLENTLIQRRPTVAPQFSTLGCTMSMSR